MRLLEMFLTKWKEGSMDNATQLVIDEMERRYGVVSDENKIEKAFFLIDKHGNMTGNAAFYECMELFAVVKELDLYKSDLYCYLQEVESWYEDDEMEKLEKTVDKNVLRQIAAILYKMTKIFYKKKLLILKEVDGNWILAESCSLEDYDNGDRTFGDLHVRTLLLKYSSEKIRLIVVSETSKGECCFEI